MDGFGRLLGTTTIRFERILPGPVDRVWACLTESDKRARWLAAGEMELHVGGVVRLHFRNDNLSAEPEPAPERFRTADGTLRLNGRVTRYEPPQLLSFTWGELS